MMDPREGGDMAGNKDREATSASNRRRRGPVARLALTRRVLAALEPLEGAEIEADVENPALAPNATSTPRLRTDLMIRALDLRIRVALQPGADANELASNEVLDAGLSMLVGNPETASVLVIADDEELTCRIIEPFDRPDAITSAESAEDNPTLTRSGPASRVVRAYLRQINPHWDPPPRVSEPPTELDEAARRAADDALAKLQAQRKNTPEWREARGTLSDADARWISELALSALLDEPEATAIIARLNDRTGGKP